MYRDMVPLFLGRGFRVVAPDHLGMGRSDKPVGAAEHTYAKHVARTKAFVRAVLADESAAGRLTLVAHARHDSAEDFSRLNALLFTAMGWIFIPVYYFAVP